MSKWVCVCHRLCAHVRTGICAEGHWTCVHRSSWKRSWRSECQDSPRWPFESIAKAFPWLSSPLTHHSHRSRRSVGRKRWLIFQTRKAENVILIWRILSFRDGTALSERGKKKPVVMHHGHARWWPWIPWNLEECTLREGNDWNCFFLYIFSCENLLKTT